MSNLEYVPFSEREDYMNLKDFMLTDEFKELPTVLDLNIENCGRTHFKDVPNPRQVHFCNGSCYSDIHPYLIVEKTKSEKTIRMVRIESEVVKGSMADGSAEYEYFVKLKDGKLDRDFIVEARKPRANSMKKRLVDFQDGCYHYYLTDTPRYYYDPSF